MANIENFRGLKVPARKKIMSKFWLPSQPLFNSKSGMSETSIWKSAASSVFETYLLRRHQTLYSNLNKQNLLKPTEFPRAFRTSASLPDPASTND